MDKDNKYNVNSEKIEWVAVIEKLGNAKIVANVNVQGAGDSQFSVLDLLKKYLLVL